MSYFGRANRGLEGVCVLQCVAVCCSILQYGMNDLCLVRCPISGAPNREAWRRCVCVLQCVAACCSVVQYVMNVLSLF